MRAPNRRKRGFTLMETVVTVGIVAALAAVVYPQVVRQFDTADPTRLQNDLKNLQTAIESFTVNLSGTAPGDLEDLANEILATDSALTTATTLPVFGSTQLTQWSGPYVDFSILEGGTTETYRETGFAAKIQDTFVCYSVGDSPNQHGVSAATSATTTANNNACPSTATGQKYVALQITGITCSASDANFLAVNELFDGAAETGQTTNGRVRCKTNGATAGGAVTVNKDVMYFLAVPLT